MKPGSFFADLVDSRLSPSPTPARTVFVCSTELWGSRPRRPDESHEDMMLAKTAKKLDGKKGFKLGAVQGPDILNTVFLN